MTSGAGPEDVLRELEPIIPVFWKAVEGGDAEARQIFAERGTSIDPWLYPCIVRWRAAGTFDAAGVERTNLPSNGLELRYRHINIRVLKADEGDVPQAGRSARRQEFFHQVPLTLFPETEVEQVNLIVVWDTGPGGVVLELVKPVTDTAYEFRVAIPTVTDLLDEIVPDVDDLEDDLPIELPENSAVDGDARDEQEGGGDAGSA
jgi:hypothetical protein